MSAECFSFKRELNSGKCLFCICWDNNVVFLLYPINIVNLVENLQKMQLSPWINSIWSWYIILFPYFLIYQNFIKKFCTDAPSILDYSSIFLWCLCLVFEKRVTLLSKLESIIFSIIFWNRLYRTGNKYFFKCLIDSPVNHLDLGVFFEERILNYYLNSVHEYWFFKFSNVFLGWYW